MATGEGQASLGLSEWGSDVRALASAWQRQRAAAEEALRLHLRYGDELVAAVLRQPNRVSSSGAKVQPCEKTAVEQFQTNRSVDSQLASIANEVDTGRAHGDLCARHEPMESVLPGQVSKAVSENDHSRRFKDKVSMTKSMSGGGPSPRNLKQKHKMQFLTAATEDSFVAGTVTSSPVLNKVLGWLARKHQWFRSLEEPRRSGCLANIVFHRYFDGMVSLVILGNCVYTTHQANYEMATLGDKPAGDLWIELAFLVVFILELVIKLCVHRLYFFVNESRSWNIFDFILVLFASLDQLFTQLGQSFGSVAFARSLRLFKMGKILRVFKAMRFLKELRVMIKSILGSFVALFWSIMMLLVFSYIFAVLLYEAMSESVKADMSESAMENWGTVPRSVLSMVQIATYDGSALARQYCQELSHPAMLIVFIMFTTIVSVAIMNLIIGMLLTVTVRLEQAKEGCEQISNRLLNHRALVELRRVLAIALVAGPAPRFRRGSPVISRAELLALVSDPRVAQSETPAGDSISFKIMRSPTDAPGRLASSQEMSGFSSALQGMRKRWQNCFASDDDKPPSYQSYFKAAGVAERDVDEVFNVLVSGCGVDGTKEQEMPLDDFIRAVIGLRKQAHSLELAEVSERLKAIYSRIEDQVTEVQHACAQISAVSSEIDGLVEENSDNTFAGAAKGATAFGQPLASDQVVFKAMGRHKTDQVALEREQKLMIACGNSFDSFFGGVVLLNIAALGLEAAMDVKNERDIRSADFDAMSLVWFIAELVFYCIYVAEAWLRPVLFYQLHVMKDYRMWLGVLPRLMWSLDIRTLSAVVQICPKVARDRMYIFELLIVGVATVDNLVLRFLQVDDAWSDAIHIVGLCRLLRICRIIGLVRPLRIIAKGFLSNARLIFWTFVLLMVIVYMAAIAMVDQVGRASGDPTIRYFWGHVGDAMITLTLMATYNGWSVRIDELGKYFTWAYPAGMLFTLLAGLGILNLVTGVMVQSAYTIVARDAEETLVAEVKHLRQTFTQAFENTATMADLHNKEREKVFETIEGILNESIILDRPMSNVDTVASRRPTTQNNASPGARDLIAMACSGYDVRNYCTVETAVWITCTEVAIRFSTMQDRRDGPDRSPELSMIAWEGGSRHPDLQRWATPPAAIKDGGPKAPASLPGPQGTLVFTGLPRGKRFTFRFGGNYQSVPLSPDGLDLQRRLKELVEVDETRAEKGQAGPRTDKDVEYQALKSGILEKLMHANASGVSLPQLELVLQERSVHAAFERVGLRPMHALFVFSELASTGPPTVPVDDILEGVIRILRPQYGLDIARSKSIMSQMITELKQLNEGAGAFRGQLIELVQALHDMRLNSRDMVEDVETGVSAFSPDESPKFRKLRHSLAPPAVASTDSREPPARGSQSSVSVPDDDGEISGDDDRGRALGMSLHDIRQELAGSISLQGQHASEHRPPLIVVGQTTVDEANEKLQHQIDKIMNHIERKLATAGLPTETVRDILSEFQAASGEEHDDDDDCSITSRDSLEAESICSAEKSWE